MEKDLLIGPMAVAAVTHSSLYWLVGGQEEDLGAMARSCWEERMKEAVVRGRRADSAVRRSWGCMLLYLLACLLYRCFRIVVCVLRRYFSIFKREELQKYTRNQRPSRSFYPSQPRERKPITPQRHNPIVEITQRKIT